MPFWDILTLLWCISFPLVFAILLGVAISNLLKPTAPPRASGLTKEQEAADAMLGDVVGRDMGWWN
jgi:hypothetical protein